MYFPKTILIAIQLIQLLFFLFSGCSWSSTERWVYFNYTFLSHRKNPACHFFAFPSATIHSSIKWINITQCFPHKVLSHYRVMPTCSRKHLFNKLGCILLEPSFYWSPGSVQYLESVVFVFTVEAPSCFSPYSFWRGVLAGRSEPNSVPLLLLFQGGRRCEPLKQQEETTGGRSDSHRQTDTDRHIVLLANKQVLCSSVQKGSCKILHEYKDIFNSPYCIQYSFIWMYYNLKCVH